MNRFKLIACEVFYREFCYSVATSKNIVDMEFVTQGLHDLDSNDMKTMLQEKINNVDTEKYKAILLGYGLCNNGITGLTTFKIPLVVPKAHDCITFFFGSKEKYREYFYTNPGTYYKTTGWIERDTVNMETMQSFKLQKLGLNKTYEEYVQLYGEENAKYILETVGKGIDNYTKYSYIDMEIVKIPEYEEETKVEAKKKNCKFEHIEGNLKLFKNLVDGNWNKEDFLILEPGYKISVTYDDKIITCVKSPAEIKESDSK